MQASHSQTVAAGNRRRESFIRAEEHTGMKRDLLERMDEARLLTDELFRLLRPDAFYDRPIAERHRLIFYLGHLEAFDWNLLRGRVFNAKPFHPEYDELFAFGIDPLGEGLPSDQATDWPSVAEVRGYIQQIRSAIDENLEENLDSNLELLDSSLTENCEEEEKDYSPTVLLNVAIEHRLMHAETLSYLLHQLPYDRKLTSDAVANNERPSIPSSAPPTSRMITIPSGSATLGLSRNQHLSNDSVAFGWDNEFEEHTVAVPAFEIDECKVSNGEYLSFVNAGGYQDRNHWNSPDWEWIEKHGVRGPVFWKLTDDAWFYRGMFSEFPLPLDWPIYVSHAEASAYARWAGKSLPNEAQWHRAAYGRGDGAEYSYPWGEQAPAPQFGYFDFERWDPVPVNAFSAARSSFGLVGLLGNGWEWTSTPFAPFNGFKPFSFYPGYSANFFDDKHFVMKGGSRRTAACMLRRSFRNWFQPHYQYVYAGFRCVNH